MTRTESTASAIRIYLGTAALDLLRAERRRRDEWPGSTAPPERGADPLTLARCYGAAVIQLDPAGTVTHTSTLASLILDACRRVKACPECLTVDRGVSPTHTDTCRTPF